MTKATVSNRTLLPHEVGQPLSLRSLFCPNKSPQIRRSSLRNRVSREAPNKIQLQHTGVSRWRTASVNLKSSPLCGVRMIKGRKTRHGEMVPVMSASTTINKKRLIPWQTPSAIETKKRRMKEEWWSKWRRRQRRGATLAARAKGLLSGSTVAETLHGARRDGIVSIRRWGSLFASTAGIFQRDDNRAAAGELLSIRWTMASRCTVSCSTTWSIFRRLPFNHGAEHHVQIPPLFCFCRVMENRSSSKSEPWGTKNANRSRFLFERFACLVRVTPASDLACFSATIVGTYMHYFLWDDGVTVRQG